MSSPSLSARGTRAFGPSLTQVTLWQLALLVAFVAVAIADIRAYGVHEPTLLALAAAGYAGFALLCWLVWHAVQRFRVRVGTVPLVAGYVAVMGAVFLAAVAIYLVIEYAYLTGGFDGLSRTWFVLS